MIDYRKMYTTMFNAVTDTLEALNSQSDETPDAILHCAAILIDAQTKCEEYYISEEKKLTVIHSLNTKAAD